MRYLGGKHRIAKQLTAAMAPHIAGCDVWEPFCGGLSMTRAMSAAGGRVRPSDAHPALIALYQAVSRGWVPPESVTEAEYAAARSLPDSDPMKAFAGFCAGFGGRFFEGYGRGEGRNFAAEGARALARDCPGRTFACINFFSVPPRNIYATIYCDPPYKGTKGYSTGAFDHDLFYRRVRDWARWQPVFVSEYEFPFGDIVWAGRAAKTVAGAGGHGGGRVGHEKLYRVRPA